jgi:hypothetical protein
MAVAIGAAGGMAVAIGAAEGMAVQAAVGIVLQGKT